MITDEEEGYQLQKLNHWLISTDRGGLWPDGVFHLRSSFTGKSALDLFDEQANQTVLREAVYLR